MQSPHLVSHKNARCVKARARARFILIPNTKKHTHRIDLSLSVDGGALIISNLHLQYYYYYYYYRQKGILYIYDLTYIDIHFTQKTLLTPQNANKRIQRKF